MKQGLKNALWAVVLLIAAAAVLYVPYRDLQTGATYAHGASAVGMNEADAESYKLYALAVREQELEVPLPIEWAKERFERLEFRPGSELEMLELTVWQPALEDEREQARQEFLARERETSLGY